MMSVAVWVEGEPHAKSLLSFTMCPPSPPYYAAGMFTMDGILKNYEPNKYLFFISDPLCAVFQMEVNADIQPDTCREMKLFSYS